MSYENFLKERELHQEEISQTFGNINNDDFLFVESPTGSGKTHIALKSAIKYLNKHNKSVIITTNTNSNAIALKKTFEAICNSYNMKSDDLEVEIGKSNYIDLDRLIETLEKFKKAIDIPGLTREAIEEQFTIKDNDFEILRNDVLFEDFFKLMNISRENGKILNIFAQDSDVTINPKRLATIERKILNKKIIVMNHSYFLILYRYYGNNKNKSFNEDFRISFFETPVIFDEFHTLFDSAKSILSNSFSLFRLKYSLDAVLKKVNSEENITFVKNLKALSINVYDCWQRVSKDDKQSFEYLAKLKTDINSRRTDNIKKKLIEMINSNFDKDQDLNKYMRFLKTELDELNNINLKSKRYIQISFSPNGFPKLDMQNGFPSYKLRDIVWNRINSPILALSATLRDEEVKDKRAFQWVIKRNGLFKKEHEEFKKYLSALKDLDEEKKEFLIEKNRHLNRKIDDARYEIYDSLFEKSNFIYTIVDNEKFTRPRVNEEKEERIIKIDNWRYNIGKFIGSNIKHNSLVLTTSYDDVKKIAKVIIEDRPDVKVFYAREGESIEHLITEFKMESKKNVCCMVGTEQYYTGLDFKGDLLLELYFAKIPFKPFKNQVGNKIFPELGFTKDENYYKETYFKFMQGIGRPIRDYMDRAIMYILDPRINKDKMLNFRKFLEKKGFKVDYQEMSFKYKEALLKDKKSTNVDNYLYVLFFDYLIDKSIEEINQLFEVKNDEVGQINIAAKKILEKNVGINKVIEKEYFLNLVTTKNYKNIWILLLKIYTEVLKTEGRNLEKEIQDNNMYGFDNLIDISKHLLLN